MWVRKPKGELNEFGEVCSSAAQCCSGLCEPDADGIARCKKQGNPDCNIAEPVCLPRGEICETDCECCGEDICRETRPADTMGQFPKRCVNSGHDTACLPTGELCGDPTECCDDLCVQWPDESFRCGAPPGNNTPPDGGVCVPNGGDCSTDTECCSSLRCVPRGANRICEIVVQ
jgi:hypothetical protein